MYVYIYIVNKILMLCPCIIRIWQLCIYVPTCFWVIYLSSVARTRYVEMMFLSSLLSTHMRAGMNVRLPHARCHPNALRLPHFAQQHPMKPDLPSTSLA